MKNLTLIYCGEDGDAGKALADDLRKDTDNKVILCSTEFFSGPEADAQQVIIMSDVPEWRVDSIREAYPGRVVAKNPIEAVTPKKVWAAQIDLLKPKRGWPKGKPRKAAT